MRNLLWRPCESPNPVVVTGHCLEALPTRRVPDLDDLVSATRCNILPRCVGPTLDPCQIPDRSVRAERGKRNRLNNVIVASQLNLCLAACNVPDACRLIVQSQSGSSLTSSKSIHSPDRCCRRRAGDHRRTAPRFAPSPSVRSVSLCSSPS